MEIDNDSVTRRGVLRATGGAVAAVGATGLGSARPGDTVEVNVGFSAASGERAALSKADEVVRAFDSIDVVTVQLPAQAADALAGRADVRYVEENGEMRALAQSLPWGVDRVDAEVAHASGDTGAGAHVAIIDTGIDSDHPDLQANLGTGRAFVQCTEGGGGCRFGAKPNDNACNQPWDDDNDHGSHCGGIADALNNSTDVVGVSTEATLHAVKVLDQCGGGSFSDVAAGIEYVADQGWDVASMSLGGGQSSAVTDAVQYAADRGVFMVAAAGNAGPCTDCVDYPAAEPEVVAVSATSKDDSLADFSSTGPEVELAAPGENIPSTTPAGVETFSGTSMSTPHVAGAAGQLMADGQSRTQARDTLTTNAEDVGLGSNEQGAGLLDVAASLGLDSSDDLGDGGGGGGGGDNPPAIDTFAVSNRSNGGWARFDVDWAVSDADGDLSSVEVVMAQNGATVDSATTSVGGSSASGSDRLQDKKGSGSYDVTLTVTDGNGNTASQTKTVTA